MDNIFTTLLTLSWQAGVIALAVALVRLPLRRAPRWAVCALWALVALRLLLPVTIESPVSLQAEEAPPIRAYHAIRQQETDDADTPVMSAPKDTPAVSIVPGEVQTATRVSGGEPVSLTRMLPWLWLTGVGCMLLYMALSYLRMWAKVRKAPCLYSNVYRCGDFGTPFVLGLFSPRIYLPDGLPEDDLSQVLTHERCHIRRGDHIVKPLAFLLLSLHWFNPALWLAYVLLGRDMERACDELALKNADAAGRAAYTRALVSCAARPRTAAVCPLAFGEIAVKERVKSVLHYKKPAMWAAVLLVIAAAVIAVCLLTTPQSKTLTDPSQWDAQQLYALRTQYVGDNAAVGAILDALGLPEMGDTADNDTYAYSIRLSTNEEPMGVTVCYAFAGDVPERSAEWNRQMAQRGYVAMALIDNIEWFRWIDIDQAGTSHVTGVVFSVDGLVYSKDDRTMVDELSAARESAESLQTYMETLRTMVADGSIVYYPGDALPRFMDFEEITPWPTLVEENDPHSVSAEDYGITYTADNMPGWYTWDTVPLSYLCAYYLNADGAYAEAAMDVLARRYQQAPDTVTAYIKSLAGQQTPNGRGDASEVLLADISAWDLGDATVDGSKLGKQVTQVIGVLSVQVTGVHDYADETVAYDENSRGSVTVYTVYPGATLDVMVAPTYDDSEGRTHGEYKLYMKNGDTIELFPQTGPFDLTNALGVGAEGAYLIRFVPYGGDYLTFNENGEGMVSVPAVKFTGSGYTMYILDDGGWERVTLPGLDGTPKVSGKNAEIWQSTYDTSARLSVVHLNAMTFRQAQEWAVDAAGKSFTLTESKQGDMSGMNTAQTMYWTCAFYGTDDDRFAVIKTYPLELTERLGYALNAMADTFTLLAVQPEGLTTTDTARLEVVRVTWETGETQTQYIPLTDAQVQTILSEKGTVQPEWHQVCATLHRSGEDDVRYWGTADYPVPPTVLKLLTEQGGYEFVTPEDFRGNMTSAKLEFYGGETYTAAQADLPALQKMLTNARPFGGASACWFTARLTVTFDDGRTVSVLKATDSCASFMFGSWNNAMVSDRENDQFWQIFGVTLEE